MLQVTNEAAKATIKSFRENGLVVSRGKAKREKFTGGEALTAGVYNPLVAGAQPATTVPPRSKSGRAYDAIAYKSPRGAIVKIGLGSIFNSIRVVNGIQPNSLTKDSKWAGEGVQPTANFFRYGKLSDMESTEVIDDEHNDEVVAFYNPTPINLSTEVVYVAPRFVDGDNKPIFDTECSLRKAMCADDYQQYPDTSAAR